MVRVPPGDRRTSQLPSKRVEAAIRARLAAREWAPGERLPAVAEFATQYAVARGTVITALRRIEADGLIEIVANWGTFRN
jgi:DNA-binding GntR family transcriptional regulator